MASASISSHASCKALSGHADTHSPQKVQTAGSKSPPVGSSPSGQTVRQVWHPLALVGVIGKLLVLGPALRVRAPLTSQAATSQKNGGSYPLTIMDGIVLHLHGPSPLVPSTALSVAAMGRTRDDRFLHFRRQVDKLGAVARHAHQQILVVIRLFWALRNTSVDRVLNCTWKAPKEK